MLKRNIEKKPLSILIVATLTTTVAAPIIAPSVSFANSTNVVDRILPVAKDFSSDKMPNVLSYLIIKEDDVEFTTGDTFRLTLSTGANWLTNYYPTNSMINGTNGAGFKVVNSTEKELELEITGTWGNGEESVEIPLYFEIDGGIGDLKVTVDPRESTLSPGQYTFATVPGEKIVITVPIQNGDKSTTNDNGQQSDLSSEPQNTMGNKVVFTIGKNMYTQLGVQKTMDIAPFIEAGRTYIPIRYVAEVVGVQENSITWDPATGKIKIIKDNQTVILTVGSNILKINDENITMDVAPKIVNGRTVLPLRAVAEALGAEVTWNQADQSIVVK